MSRLLRRLVVSTALAAGGVALALGGAAPADAAATWHTGAMVLSTFRDCQTGYVYNGVGVELGYLADTDAKQPGTGQTMQLALLIQGGASPCFGQYVLPTISLPAGLQFDLSGSITCFANGTRTTVSTDCPQNITGNTSTFTYPAINPQHANAWPVPGGESWEFHFPIKVVAAGAMTVTAAVQVADGDLNPTLTPSVSLYAFSHAYGVSYPSPSTKAAPTTPGGGASKYGIVSTGHVVTGGVPGTAYLRRGTSPSSMPNQTTVGLSSGTTTADIWTDWDETGFPAVVPGQTYYWQLGFQGVGDPAVTWGATQSFVAPLATTCAGKKVTVALSLGQTPTSGDDVIVGTNGNDTINAGAGNDTVCALGGNDTVDGGPGNDTLDGGTGTDTLTYATAPAAVKISLATTAAQATGGSGTDKITAFENLTGLTHSDTLTGSAAANTIHAGAGNDTVRGGAGNDKLYGEAGNDKVYGEAGNDAIDGGAGTDTADGGVGTDTAVNSETKVSIP